MEANHKEYANKIPQITAGLHVKKNLTIIGLPSNGSPCGSMVFWDGTGLDDLLQDNSVPPGLSAVYISPVESTAS